MPAKHVYSVVIQPLHADAPPTQRVRSQWPLTEAPRPSSLRKGNLNAFTGQPTGQRSRAAKSRQKAAIWSRGSCTTFDDFDTTSTISDQPVGQKSTSEPAAPPTTMSCDNSGCHSTAAPQRTDGLYEFRSYTDPRNHSHDAGPRHGCPTTLRQS